MTIYPNKLNKGDTIGITATSSSANELKIDRAIENLEELGYNVLETSNIRNPNIKCVSSDAKTRAKEFIDLWKDNNVKYIIEARGGEFLMETLPLIHKAFQEEKLYENVKWLQGYSDVTTLLFYLTTWYNIATIEATNVSNYAMKPLHKSIYTPMEVISEKETFIQENYPYWEIQENELDPNFCFNLTEESKVKSLDGKDNYQFEGVLIGGCLDVVSNYVGTKWDNVANFIEQYKDKGIIWHLENCELSAPDVYRALWFMRENDWFKYTKGFIIGRTFIQDDNPEFTYLDALQKGIGELNVPVIYDTDIGHVPPQWTIINGCFAKVKYENGNCTIEQKFE